MNQLALRQNPQNDFDIDQALVRAGIDPESEHFSGGMTQQPLTSSLLAHVKREWASARIAKEGDAERRLFRALRQRLGYYDEDKLAAIREMGGSDIYMMLTQVKCRATESWISEILFPAGESPFGIEAGSIPDMPPDLAAQAEDAVLMEVQELIDAGAFPSREAVRKRAEQVKSDIMNQVREAASERAERMEKKIADIFEEGHWQEQLEELIPEFVTFPTAFFKGPTRIRKKRLKYVEDEYGQVTPQVTTEPVLSFERVSPFDIYPGADSVSLDDGALFHVQRFRRQQIYNLIGLPGYSEEAIRKVLFYYGDTGYSLHRACDSQREHLEGRDNEDWAPHGTLEALNFWGPVRGTWLLEWGIDPEQIPDQDADYEANIIVIGEHIIRAALNPHPLGHRPYNSASFESIPGQIWGRGVPDLISDIQDMCNAAARSLANNMALASGPMADVEVDRLADGERVGRWYPWRTIQTQSGDVTNSRRAVEFFQPDSNADALMKVYKFYSELADEYSGIPPYAQGVNTTGGAAGTATGLMALMDSAARGVKRGVKSLDRGIIKPSVERTFEDVMIYDDDQEIKGDLRVIAKASSAMAQRERMALRRGEMAQATGQNPMDQRIIGLMGRRKQLEDWFRSLDLDPEGIVPEADELRQQLRAEARAMQMEAQQQGQVGQDQTAAGEPQGGPQPEQRANG